MGTWGEGFFDDDLALDVLGGFEAAVAGGQHPADAAAALLRSDLAREILDELPPEERDAAFWEESAGLFYATASLQLRHGVLQDDVRDLTLQMIAAERGWLDPVTQPARWQALDDLEAQLRRS